MTLPAPPIPPDVDLRDFAFMPLDAARLRDARIVDAVSGDEFRAAVLLWCASWHQVPAGSLPDDDVQLAKFAGYGRVVKEWKKVRDGALYGFVKCADSRLYHPTVCEKAAESWAQKQAYSARKEAERLRKAEERLRKSGACPPDNERLSNVTDSGSPPENALKGQGEGQGEERKKENPSHPAQTREPGGPGAGGLAGLSDEFRGKILDAVGTEPCRNDPDLGPIAALLAAGCTEADVLAGIAAALKKITDRIHRWSAFDGFVRTAWDARTAEPRKVVAKPVASPTGLMVQLRSCRMSEGAIRAAHAEGRWHELTMGPPPGKPGCMVERLFRGGSVEDEA